MPLQVEIVTPERLLLAQEADMVLLPGAAGQMGVMAGHVPLLTTLTAGEIVLFRNNAEEEILAVGGDLRFRTGCMAENGRGSGRVAIHCGRFLWRAWREHCRGTGQVSRSPDTSRLHSVLEP